MVEKYYSTCYYDHPRVIIHVDSQDEPCLTNKFCTIKNPVEGEVRIFPLPSTVTPSPPPGGGRGGGLIIHTYKHFLEPFYYGGLNNSCFLFFVYPVPVCLLEMT